MTLKCVFRNLPFWREVTKWSVSLIPWEGKKKSKEMEDGNFWEKFILGSLRPVKGVIFFLVALSQSKAVVCCYLSLSFFLFELTLLPRLEWECSGMISAHCNPCLQDSSNSSASAFGLAGITSVCYHAWLSFVFLVDTRFHHVGQAGLELLTSNNPPASTSQSAGITDVSYHAWPQFLYF